VICTHCGSSSRHRLVILKVSHWMAGIPNAEYTIVCTAHRVPVVDDMPGLRHKLVVRRRKAGVAYPGAAIGVHLHLPNSWEHDCALGTMARAAGRQPGAGPLVASGITSTTLYLSKWERQLCLNVVSREDAERPAETVPCRQGPCTYTDLCQQIEASASMLRLHTKCILQVASSPVTRMRGVRPLP
jgi:hypothetical protein